MREDAPIQRIRSIHRVGKEEAIQKRKRRIDKMNLRKEIHRWNRWFRTRKAGPRI